MVATLFAVVVFLSVLAAGAAVGAAVAHLLDRGLVGLPRAGHD